MKEIEAYEVIKAKHIKEFESDTVMYRHKKSGARVFTMANDDNNKVFAIGFRTPPADSTGLPHILEHSVLCGSRKFPTKDPFVELAKGSLNTFLNAMTYPDKTVYPVASCNDKDFENLMDVYMDAVLYPNIYENEKIFRQEGWHYELEDADSDLIINGVVYNEMKGAFSNSDEVIERKIKQGLFPDNCYANESGGDPEDIPTLSYDDFKSFHKKYYHPSNSYIFIYGDVDMEAKLSWLDKEYLSAFDAIEVDSEIGDQPEFSEGKEETVYIPITDDQSEDEEACLAIGWMCGESRDVNLRLALSILEHALISTPGAPLRQALLDAGLASDVYGGAETDVKQNYFSLIAKSATADKKDEFVKVIRECLQKLVDEGLDKDILLSGINSREFSVREGDTGRYPKGLLMGLDLMGLWLYDDEAVFNNLEYEPQFKAMKEMAAGDGFEKLIRKYFLDNPHNIVISAIPEKGMQKQADADMVQKMAELKASWSDEQIAEVVKNTNELALWQETPDDPKELEKIPLLSRDDLKREIIPFGGNVIKAGETRVFHSDIFTSGICYLKFMFDAGDVSDEDLPYLGLLSRVLGMFDTKNYSYRDLANKIGIESGGLGVTLNTYDKNKTSDFILSLDVSVKVFNEKIAFPFEIIEEMLYETDFSSEKRLKELLDENKYGVQGSLMSAGHSAAMLRSASRHSKLMHVKDRYDGIDFYHFLEDACADFDNCKEKIREKLESLCREIFVPERMMVSVTCDAADFETVPERVQKFADKHKSGQNACEYGSRCCDYHYERKNEGFQTPASISYVAMSGNFRKAGLEYNSTLNVLKTILSYGYLWEKVRVRGGAYGAMCSFSRSGEGGFVSYRDPNLKETLAVYNELADYVENFDVDERNMTKFLIGTLSTLDIPMSPAARGARNLAMYLNGSDMETEQKYRDAILDVSPEDIRALAPLMRAIIEKPDICVIGNETKISDAADVFDSVNPLFSAK